MFYIGQHLVNIWSTPFVQFGQHLVNTRVHLYSQSDAKCSGTDKKIRL